MIQTCNLIDVHDKAKLSSTQCWIAHQCSWILSICVCDRTESNITVQALAEERPQARLMTCMWPGKVSGNEEGASVPVDDQPPGCTARRTVALVHIRRGGPTRSQGQKPAKRFDFLSSTLFLVILSSKLDGVGKFTVKPQRDQAYSLASYSLVSSALTCAVWFCSVGKRDCLRLARI